MVHQYGVSIKSSTKVREIFRQITQKLWATKTRELENCLYISLYNISFFWLLPLNGFQFIFLLRVSENDLYANVFFLQIMADGTYTDMKEC